MLLHPPEGLLLTERGDSNEPPEAMLGMLMVIQTPNLATSVCTPAAANPRQGVHLVARVETTFAAKQNWKQGICAFQMCNV